MNQYNPSGRIQRVPGGSLQSPGTCFVCTGPSQPVYALLGHTEWEGSVYLCKFCAMSVMTVFEDLMIPADEESLRREIGRLEGKLRDKDKVITNLKAKNVAYQLVLTDLGHDDSVSNGASGSVSALPPKNDGNIVTESRGFTGESNNFDQRPNVSDALDFGELDSNSQRATPGTVPPDFDSGIEPAGTAGKQVARERRNSGNAARSEIDSLSDFGAI